MISEEFHIYTTTEVAEILQIPLRDLKAILRYLGLDIRGGMYNLGERELKVLYEIKGSLS